MTRTVPFRKRLQVRLATGVLLLAYLPLGAGGFIAYVQARSGYQEQAGQNVEAVANLVRSRVVDAIKVADDQLTTWGSETQAKQAATIGSSPETSMVLSLLANRFRQFLVSQRQLLPIFDSILCVKPPGPESPTSQGAVVLFGSDPQEEGKSLFPDFWSGDATPTVSQRYVWGMGQKGTFLASSPFHPDRTVLPLARGFADAEGKPVALIGLLGWQQLQELVAEQVVGARKIRDLASRGEMYVLFTDPEGRVLGGVLPPKGLSNALGGAVLRAARDPSKRGEPVEIDGLGEVFLGLNADAGQGIQAVAIQSASVALAPIRKLRNTMALAGLFTLTAILVLGFRITRGMTAPVKQLVDATQVAAGGDLQKTIGIRADGEIGLLVDSVNELLEHLRRTVSTLQESTGVLTGAVQTLDAHTRKQDETVNLHGAALQQTHVTAQEIKQMSLLAAEKASGVLRTADQVEMISRAGEDAVNESASALTDIQGQVTEISDRIQQLQERAKDIGEVTGTVQSLADRTRMLAINATIEAVRSGEAGRGFAVVAKEMQGLAKASISSTMRVRAMLEEVSRAISGVVTASDSGLRRVEAGLGQVRTSGDKLHELTGLITEALQDMRQIAAAVGQQNQGITEIFTSVTQQTKMMDATLEQLRQVREATALVQDASKRMTDLVQQFKI